MYQKVGIQVLNDKQYTTDKLQQLNKTNTSAEYRFAKSRD